MLPSRLQDDELCTTGTTTIISSSSSWRKLPVSCGTRTFHASSSKPPGLSDEPLHSLPSCETARRARSYVQCATSQRATSDRLNGQPSSIIPSPRCATLHLVGGLGGAVRRTPKPPGQLSILVRPVSFSDDGLVFSGGFQMDPGRARGSRDLMPARHCL